MDEKNPDPVLEKLKRHLEMLERKGGKDLRDFKRKLNKFKGKLRNLNVKLVDSNPKSFFKKLFT